MSVLRFIILGLLVYQPVQALQNSVEFSSSNLPVVVIDTQGQDIPFDNPRVVADMRVIFNGRCV